jgi:primosomal protein N' (replication factor Y)
VLILGSATPSIETYHASESTAAASNPPPGSGYQSIRIVMPRRIDDRPLPAVEVVDLREEFQERRALFSRRLEEAIASRLAEGRQTILFLNRRGYGQFVLCRECGYVARCPHCAVSLAFHAYERSLRCHHCDYAVRSPQECPDCGGGGIRSFGIGTERVEEEVARLFPDARTARMDRDTTSRKGEHTRLVRGFRAGEADILIGTQMVAKGFDFPNVTLVGVISADTSINMPDFRAAERTFQLLTQVAGRAGRGAAAGEVIVQTFSPDHFAIQAAVRQDYAEFFEQEIAFRRELRYPPFSRLANMVSADESESEAQERAERVAAALAGCLAAGTEVIGPAPAPLARLKSLYRFHVALRAPVAAPIADYIRAALGQLSPADRLRVTVDVDPLNMA